MASHTEEEVIGGMEAPELTKPAVLATDLDGTLIPLPGEAENASALEVIRREREGRGFKLVYATGRHLESVREAMEGSGLPEPDWMVCDVGSSIYGRVGNTGQYERFGPFERYLERITEGHGRGQVENCLACIDGLIPQSPERQGRFKISYECAVEQLEAVQEEVCRRLAVAAMPYACMGSVDPFEQCGLLDVLPVGVTKAHALTWLSAHADFSPGEVVFAGDSGNDRAALASGFRAILVGNGSEELAASVYNELEARSLQGRFYRAKGKATSGVLEGCRFFGLIPDAE